MSVTRFNGGVSGALGWGRVGARVLASSSDGPARRGSPGRASPGPIADSVPAKVLRAPVRPKPCSEGESELRKHPLTCRFISGPGRDRTDNRRIMSPAL